MSPTDANLDLARDLDLDGARRAAAAGFPDPARLAQLATKLFAESQGIGTSDALAAVDGLQLEGAPFRSLASSTPAVPVNALPMDVVPTNVVQTNVVPTNSLTPSARPVNAALPTTDVAALSRGHSPSEFSLPETAGAFGFLDGLRGFGEVPVAVPGIPSTPRVPEVPSTPPTTPAVPGASVPSELSSPSYAFLDEVRPLFPIDVVPSVVPATSGFEAPLRVASGPGLFDVNAIRRDFPILQERVHGRPLVWLDNAATTQKPQAVIDRLSHFYSHENSNIHRAAHTLAARATDAYEGARETVRRFLNAGSVQEIIFVRGATEGINLVAQSWGRRNVRQGDEIVVKHLEHHANIVPWQMLCAEKGARLKVAPVDDTGQVILEEYEKLLTPATRLVALTHVSNALGTVTPAEEMVRLAHRHGAKVLVDGAQAVSHMAVDVQRLGCDFYVFSGHKVFAPTGIGVVFGRTDVLEQTPPWQGGGNMIRDVTFEKTTYHPPPGRFEAGTGNIADAVGLGAALEYVERVGMPNIARYEHDLLVYGTDALRTIPGLRLVGTAAEKASVLSFVLDGFKTEEVGAALDREGIAVRSGHHCAQPILRRFGLEATVRPSLAFYNTCEEVDALVAAIWNLKNGRSPGLS